jgi:hypothetical protein
LRDAESTVEARTRELPVMGVGGGGTTAMESGFSSFREEEAVTFPKHCVRCIRVHSAREKEH